MIWSPLCLLCLTEFNSHTTSYAHNLVDTMSPAVAMSAPSSLSWVYYSPSTIRFRLVLGHEKQNGNMAIMVSSKWTSTRARCDHPTCYPFSRILSCPADSRSGCPTLPHLIDTLSTSLPLSNSATTEAQEAQHPWFESLHYLSRWSSPFKTNQSPDSSTQRLEQNRIAIRCRRESSGPNRLDRQLCIRTWSCPTNTRNLDHHCQSRVACLEKSQHTAGDSFRPKCFSQQSQRWASRGNNYMLSR